MLAITGTAGALAIAAIAAGVTCAAAPALIPLLRQIAMDAPVARSSHAVPIPRGGGLAVVAGIAAAVGTAAVIGDIGSAWYLLAGVVFLGVLGFVDDLRTLPAPVRLIAQIGVAVAYSAHFDRPGVGLASVIGAVVSIVFIVGYVNAFNFMDGINGVSSFSAALAGVWFAVIGLRGDDPALVVIGAAVCGAAIGFMPWNVSRARIFLGDVGSYALGGAIAAMALLAWSTGEGLLTAVAPLVVYFADTGWVLTKRAFGGRPILEPHREHVYQRVLDRTGWQHWAVALLVVAATGVCCAAIAAGDVLGKEVVAVVGVLIAVLGYQSAPRIVSDRRP